MRIMTLAAIAAVLAAPLAADPASAQTKAQARKKVPARPRKADPIQFGRDWAEMQGGGAVGCASSSLPERQRLAMQRYGAQPCDNEASPPPREVGGPITPTVRPPMPPAVNPANYGPWPVGLWIPASRSCATAGRMGRVALGLNKDGSYQGPNDSGDWKIVGAAIEFSFRDLSQWGGQPATNDMERISPLKARRTPFAKRSDGTITLAGTVWKRCSRDPYQTEF